MELSYLERLIGLVMTLFKGFEGSFGYHELDDNTFQIFHIGFWLS
jgi:hypothetical protein